jgi:hypothetical protein
LKLLNQIKPISIFSNSSHLEWMAGLSVTILQGAHPGTIPARFGLICFSGFKGEDLNVIFYQNIPNLKPNLAGMVPGWAPCKIVTDSPAIHSRWLLLLKIEISSIVHAVSKEKI